MGVALGEMRGRVTIRPWRVGFIVDTESREAVRDAIADLSSVWGGASMPIFDVRTPVVALEDLGHVFDVDALWGEDLDGEVRALADSPGWVWRGRGPWGPFGEEGGVRKGLLPARVLADGTDVVTHPGWDADDQADLVFASMWGLADRWEPSGESHTAVLLQQVLGMLRRSVTEPIGVLAVGNRHLRFDGLDRDADLGIYLIRPDVPADAVEHWNRRAIGEQLIGVPASGHLEVVQHLLSARVPREDVGSPESRTLRVWGLSDADPDIYREIESTAERAGLTLAERERGLQPDHMFPGLRTPFVRTIRADFRPSATSVDVSLPAVPLDASVHRFNTGVVAADVRLHRVTTLDPRLTASIPPYRRQSSLLQQGPVGDRPDHARVTKSGYVLGVDALDDQLCIPFAQNLDVLHHLFGDEASVNQSEVGRFQTRAAEKLGGPFSGVLSQPGVRAALIRAARRPSGLTLPHLRQLVEKERGEWPDPLYSTLSPTEYAHSEVNRLLASEIFVPTLRVHCSHCRVASRVSADSLAAMMPCEFCGDEFSLALSHSLASPEWVYRLVAHLRSDQVQALLPALAASSLLAQMRHVEEPPIPLVLGLEVSIGGRKVEVDVAAYLPDYDWAVVLGEVKTSNQVDSGDVGNLEFLRNRLVQEGVRCQLMFVTLKSTWSDAEKQLLRGLVERSRVVRSSRGHALPSVPLVLTGPDVSHPPGSDDHPWQWDSKGYAGVLGTAVTSCERNLGLRSYELPQDDESSAIRFEWTD